MKIRRTNGERAFDAFNTLFMIALSLITVYPLLYVIFAAFSTPTEFVQHEGLLFYPLKFTTIALRSVLNDPNIFQGYRNTLIIVIGGTAINIFMTILGAYVLSRKGMMFGRPLTLIIIFTMYFHGGMIPSYLLVQSLGLMDTYWALMLPGAVNTFNLVIMRTAFAGVPESLEESAKLDGASSWTVMWRIMAPLTMPTIAVLLLYYGVSHWNSWFSASIYLPMAPEKQPLQLLLRQIIIMGNETVDQTVLEGGDALEKVLLGRTVRYATIIVATVPILCVYPFLQRYFTKGIMVGAVKG